MRKTSLLVLICSLALVWSGSADAGEKPKESVPTDPEKTNPIETGKTVPDLKLRTLEGEEVSLHDLFSAGPSLLIVYRGGWCPYCNKHLGKVSRIEGDLKELGFQVLAVSPDRPEELAKTADKESLSYTLLSDSKVELAKALGLAFVVDDKTIKKYHGYGIDLEKASGEDHHMLPVPAVLLLDTGGTVEYIHANPNYKKRLDNESILAAAKKVAGK